MKTLLAITASIGLAWIGMSSPTPVSIPASPPNDQPRPLPPIDPIALQQPIVQPVGGFNPVPPRPVLVRVPPGYSVLPGDYQLEWQGGYWMNAPILDVGLYVHGGADTGRWCLCYNQSPVFSVAAAFCDSHFIAPDGSWACEAKLPNGALRFIAAPLLVWQP